MAPKTKNAPILDLSTLIDRPKIRIDGAMYEIFSAEELSVLDSHRFSELGKAIHEAAGEDNQDKVGELVSEVAHRALVDCPGNVFDRLSGSQKMAISEVFMQLLRRRKTQLAGAIAKTVLETHSQTKPVTPTGEKSSRVSSATTAETPTGGSDAPRPRS